MERPSAARLHPLGLVPPGTVVNTMKGDADERRAGGWLEWDGALEGLRAALVGIPFDGASVVRTGSRGGPDAVRRGMMWFTTYSTSEACAMDGFRAADVGDVLVNLTDMTGTFQRITQAVAGLVERGIVPVTIGGDHSITFPCLRGVAQALGSGKRLGIIHFDAHHDLRAAHLGAESSGVPFRKALELMPEAVRGQNLVQIGIAEFSNSPQLADYARAQGVTVIPGRGLRHKAMEGAVTKALQIAGDGTEAIYLSVDIDCIDQAQAPGTAAPNPFGLDLRDVQEALRQIGAHPKITGMDLVEISPPYDRDDMTGRAGASLVLSFLHAAKTAADHRYKTSARICRGRRSLVVRLLPDLVLALGSFPFSWSGPRAIPRGAAASRRAKDFTMADPVTPERSREIKVYRDMAESCRKMAASSRRPQSLILRAQAFEDTALALERGDDIAAKGD